MNRFSVIILILILNITILFPQDISTAAMYGRVLDNTRLPLPGATLQVIHMPSGSVWETFARPDARYNFGGLQPGLYRIVAGQIGYRTDIIDSIVVRAGDNININFFLYEELDFKADTLISQIPGTIFNAGVTGASTWIDRETLNNIPVFSRGLEDFTRLTPQSSGISFAGRDNRFNNYTVNGMIMNDFFGSEDFGFSGINPISPEFISEIKVNIASYDVRQGEFSGANVNINTIRGDNRFRGKAYTLFTDGNSAGITSLVHQPRGTGRIYRVTGATAGGPIIKDRIFFFLGIEHERAVLHEFRETAMRPGQFPDGMNVSRVPAERLEFVEQMMSQLYGYDAGPPEGYELSGEGLRLNARVDINLGWSNKFTVSAGHYGSTRDGIISSNSLSYHPEGLRFRNTYRFGEEAKNFRNSHYKNDIDVTFISGELNSLINTRMANTFRAGFMHMRNPARRIPGNQAFPFIEVLEFEGSTPLYYMTLGNELFSVNHENSAGVFSLGNSFSWFAGRHDLTFGMNLEYMAFSASFNPVFNGFYRFNSYENFVAAVIDRDPLVRPDLFLQGYSTGSQDSRKDEFSFARLGIYLQDRWEVHPWVSLVFGLRVDLPFFPGNIPQNPLPELQRSTFTNPRTGLPVSADAGRLPSLHAVVSPRAGFTIDLLGDMSLQLRGGTGIFAGRIPFSWIYNQLSENGVSQNGFSLTPAQWGMQGKPEWQGFQPEVDYYRPDGTEGSAVPPTLALIDRDFRMPRVWRSSIAVDYILPGEVHVTLEGIFSLDFNNPLPVNLNSAIPALRMNDPFPYPWWISPDDYYEDDRFFNVMFLTNQREGFYSGVTAELSRSFGRHGGAWIAYTHSTSVDYGLTGGTLLHSLWPHIVAGDRNEPEIGFSRFDRPNRFITGFSFNTRGAADDLNTGVTIIYEGGEGGRFSYTYSGIFNDGAARLMYIPASFEDSWLVDKTENGVVVMTAEQQWSLLDAFIMEDNYLNSNRGRVAERNAARMPWIHRIDLRLTQNIGVRTSRGSFMLQGFVDVLNIGNLLNSGWGTGTFHLQKTLLNFEGIDPNANARFTLNTVPGTNEFPPPEAGRMGDHSAAWSILAGFRMFLNPAERPGR